MSSRAGDLATAGAAAAGLPMVSGSCMSPGMDRKLPEMEREAAEH